jgi:hypothetical protein
MRDMTKNVQAKRVLSPVSVADNTAQVGQVIDHQGYNGALYTILIGSVADADATFTVLLEESDASGSGYAAVADADMNSQGANAAETDAAFQFDDDNEVRKIGYSGQKRYTRLTITPASNASAAVLAAVCHLGMPSIKPVVQAAA